MTTTNPRKFTRVIGLMSGTSLDGLDICLAEFHENSKGEIEYQLLRNECVPYRADWKHKLQHAHQLTGIEILKLDHAYGKYLGQKVNAFIQKHQISSVDLIASHGHTIFHEPQNQFTFQLGNGQAIYQETGIEVVYDFRTLDVLRNGQGAPLVPLGDQLLFGEFDACLNLGGIANISFKSENTPTAFDIVPFNLVLNTLVQKVGKTYDHHGQMAQKGKIIQSLLTQLNNLPYYSQPAPKSLGREWIEAHIFPLILNQNYPINDLQRTWVEHAAMQIAQVFEKNQIEQVLVTGGGAYHSFWVQRMKNLTQTKLHIPTPELIEFKEALIFALLGWLKTQQKTNVYASVTGASKNSSAGIWLKE